MLAHRYNCDDAQRCVKGHCYFAVEKLRRRDSCAKFEHELYMRTDHKEVSYYLPQTPENP